jgi:hypothetical protein
MKNLAIIFLIFLFSCSSSSDDDPNNGENPTTTDRYKISFQAESNAGNKHFKVTYVFNNATPIVVNYDGNVPADGFKTFNNIQEDIDFKLEMTSGSCWLKNIQMKIEDLQTGQIFYQTQNTDNLYIISPDMLTEKTFLNNLYGYPPQNFNPQNNYKYSFSKSGTIYYRNYPDYSYKPEILVNKPTRGSLRVVINNNNVNGYQLSIPNAWAIRDYVIGSALNEKLSSTNIFNNTIDKTYELILPGHLSNINVNLRGVNVSATIYLMRKNGTTQTENVTSTNNQNIVTNLNL